MRHSIHSIFFDQVAAHEEGERYDEALVLMYQVHRWAPQDPDLWLRMGVLSFLLTDRAWLKRSGKEDGHLADMGAVNAELYLDRALSLAPGSSRALFWAGWVRQALYQRPDEARHLLKAAAAQEHPYALAGLARIEVALAAPGYGERAIAHLQAALGRLPESARFHYDLGALLEGLGRSEQASAAFARARACPRLPAAPGAEGRYLANQFHADGEAVGELIDRLYPRFAAR